MLLGLAALLYVTVLTRLDLPVAAIMFFSQESTLYALTIALALRPPPALGRRVLFVVLSPLFAAAATYCGSWFRDGVEFLVERGGGRLGSYGEDTLTVAAIAAFGAAAYGFLLRQLWLPELSRSAPILIASACTVVMLVMMRTVSLINSLHWFIVLWWCTFSGGLWWFCREGKGVDGALSKSRA